MKDEDISNLLKDRPLKTGYSWKYDKTWGEWQLMHIQLDECDPNMDTKTKLAIIEREGDEDDDQEPYRVNGYIKSLGIYIQHESNDAQVISRVLEKLVGAV